MTKSGALRRLSGALLSTGAFILSGCSHGHGPESDPANTNWSTVILDNRCGGANQPVCPTNFGNSDGAIEALTRRMEQYRERVHDRNTARDLLANITIPASGLALYLALTGQTDDKAIPQLTSAIATAWALGQYHEDTEASSVLWRGYAALGCVAYRSTPYLMTDAQAWNIIARLDGAMMANNGYGLPDPGDYSGGGLVAARESVVQALTGYRIATANNADDADVIALTQAAEAAIQRADALQLATENLVFVAQNSGLLIANSQIQIEAQVEREIDENRRSVAAIISLATDINAVAGRFQANLPAAATDDGQGENDNTLAGQSTDPAVSTRAQLLSSLAVLGSAHSDLYSRVTPRIRAASRLGAPSSCSIDSDPTQAQSALVINPPDTVISLQAGQTHQIALSGGQRPYMVSVTPTSDDLVVERSGFDQAPVVTIRPDASASAGQYMITIEDGTERRQVALRVNVVAKPADTPTPAATPASQAKCEGIETAPQGYANGPQAIIAQVATRDPGNGTPPVANPARVDGKWGPCTGNAVRELLGLEADAQLPELNQQQIDTLEDHANNAPETAWQLAESLTDKMDVDGTVEIRTCAIKGARSVYECRDLSAEQLGAFVAATETTNTVLTAHTDWSDISDETVFSALRLVISELCTGESAGRHLSLTEDCRAEVVSE